MLGTQMYVRVGNVRKRYEMESYNEEGIAWTLWYLKVLGAVLSKDQNGVFD